MKPAAAGPKHMPWDGSHQPFAIGLRPLDLNDWIEVDVRLGEYLAEKERLFAKDSDAVFAEMEGTRAAQAEVLALLAAYLPGRFPDIYRRSGPAIEIVSTGRRVEVAEFDGPPLLTASRLMQEDLVLMRRAKDGWRLVVASLSFPSTWSLRAKFGKPLHEIHRPVPQFGPATRNAELINRIFDNLKPANPVWRANWSLYPDDELHHGQSKIVRYGAPDRTPGEERFVRVEYQTLRKLPDSGDILFTIRIHIDPLAFLEAHPDGKRLAVLFHDSLARLDADQLAYKGLTRSQPVLLERLAAIADHYIH